MEHGGKKCDECEQLIILTSRNRISVRGALLKKIACKSLSMKAGEHTGVQDVEGMVK